MADYSIFGAIALTGGGDGKLDAIDGNSLDDGDVAIVTDATNNKAYVYTLDSSAGDGTGTDESSPELIIPNTNYGTKGWVLVDIIGHDGTTQHDLSSKANVPAVPDAANLSGMDANGNMTDSAKVVAQTPQLNAATEWTAQQNFNEDSVTSSSNAVAWDWDTDQCTLHTLTENTTISAPTNANVGSIAYLRVVQAAGLYTLAWNAAFDWGTQATPAEPAASGDSVLFGFYYDGTNYLGVELVRKEA